MAMITASCTWGDGPDVMLFIEGYRAGYPLRCHETGETISVASIGITAADARSLSRQLTEAANLADQFNLELSQV